MDRTIIRTNKGKGSSGYFVASRALFEDKGLSWAARGVLGYLLAKPDNWRVKPSDLQARGDCGRDAIQAILRELESCGYLYRRRVNKGGGKFEWIYEVYESPELNPHIQKTPSPEKPSMVEPSPDLPSTVEPSTVEPSTANPATYRIVSKQNNHEPNTHTHKEAPAAPAPGVGVRSKFSLEACRRYADHLKAKGEGITNPGGYATAIFRSGEADVQIEAFLNPEKVSQQVDLSACPDCRGGGFRYADPTNFDKGVVPCAHQKIKQPGAPNVITAVCGPKQ
jgi:hypothetical protein